MKKYLWGAAALLLASCSGSSNKSYTITGELEGLPDSTVVVLTKYSHINNDTIAETMLIDGKFEFKGEQEEPLAVLVGTKGAYGSKLFMLDNSNIAIKGAVKVQEPRPGTTYYDFDAVEVTGSLLTDTLNNLMAGRREINDRFNAFQEKYAPLRERIGNEGRTEEIVNSDEYKAMGEEEHNLFKSLEENYQATIEANKESYWGPLMMICLLNYLSPDQREVFDGLSENAKNSYYGQEVYTELYPVGKPGDKMQPVNGVDKDGEAISLESVSKGKKYVLLDFWASWCRPCRAEIPNLKEQYAKYADKGFEIFSISIDQDEMPWIKALESEGLTWPNMRDSDHSVADAYKISAVPTMYLLDGEGRLVAENLRGEALAQKLAELFAE